jgi:hypothetical protein
MNRRWKDIKGEHNDDTLPLHGTVRHTLQNAYIDASLQSFHGTVDSTVTNMCQSFTKPNHTTPHFPSRTDLIGRGAYGIVYKGTQHSTGDVVAIKRIPFADSTPEGGVPCNVIREISLLRELDHPNVVKLLDIIQSHPGGLYLVFEFVAYDLKTFMDKHQTSDDINDRVGLPIPMVRSFLRQILAGVGFCHTYRVLHRDLKPHNVSAHTI